MSLNKITLIGWTGKDPEVKTLDNGTQKAAFTLATTKRGYTLPDGRTVEPVTTWHFIVAYGTLAEWIGKYVKKGSSVDVDGELQCIEYVNENKVTVKNGLPTNEYAKDRFYFVQAKSIDFFNLGVKKKEDEQSNGQPAQQQAPASASARPAHQAAGQPVQQQIPGTAPVDDLPF